MPICEPYKSGIGKHWRFKTKAIATESSQQIFALFRQYVQTGDFVGADMARKYLQMVYTRARRYANYKGGKKYDERHGYAMLERSTGAPEKAEATNVFYAKWKEAEANAFYATMKKTGKMQGVKTKLPQKICATCGKPLAWRKKCERSGRKLNIVQKNADGIRAIDINLAAGHGKPDLFLTVSGNNIFRRNGIG